MYINVCICMYIVLYVSICKYHVGICLYMYVYACIYRHTRIDAICVCGRTSQIGSQAVSPSTALLIHLRMLCT